MKPVSPGQVEGDEASEYGRLRTAESGSALPPRFACASRCLRLESVSSLSLGCSSGCQRLRLASSLQERCAVADGCTSWSSILRRTGWSDCLPAHEIDVAVLHASCLNLGCAALAHDPNFGLPELVFAFDDRSQVQRLALLSRGYRHVVSMDGLATWLHDQLTSLCALARARRIVLGACAASTPVVDMTLGTPGGGGMNLHVAETHFRETFLRALLAEYGSRRLAAAAAGVPYRSFCEMLRKLRI